MFIINVCAQAETVRFKTSIERRRAPSWALVNVSNTDAGAQTFYIPPGKELRKSPGARTIPKFAGVLQIVKNRAAALFCHHIIRIHSN